MNQPLLIPICPAKIRQNFNNENMGQNSNAKLTQQVFYKRGYTFQRTRTKNCLSLA